MREPGNKKKKKRKNSTLCIIAAVFLLSELSLSPFDAFRGNHSFKKR